MLIIEFAIIFFIASITFASIFDVIIILINIDIVLSNEIIIYNNLLII